MRLTPLIAALFAIATSPVCAQSSPSEQQPSPLPNGQPIVRVIEFRGLRRIPEETVRARIRTRAGEPLDAAKIEADVRALDRLGWFEKVRVEAEPMPLLLASASLVPLRLARAQPGGEPSPLLVPAPLRIVFVFEERPFLAGIRFRGSRVLDSPRLQQLLAANGVALGLAAPAKGHELWRAQRVIQLALLELGYPKARVRVRLEISRTHSAVAVFEIDDGPKIEVARIEFEGNTAIPDSKLRAQMKQVSPGALFAGIRGKTIYTPERLAADLERVQEYYRNRGYAEAALGTPEVKLMTQRRRRWLPWPRQEAVLRYQVTVPVTEGPRYRIANTEFVGIAPATLERSRKVLHAVEPGEFYSLEKLMAVRDRLAKLHLAAPAQASAGPHRDIEVLQRFDRQRGLVHLTFRSHRADPILVRRIEFIGHHRFSDRYYRRRIGLAEGEPFDAAKLEEGLAALAAAGFIRPVTAADIDLRMDAKRREADVKIRVQEIGRQRFSLVGGASGWGSTLGVAYNVFDLFGGEELLTAHLEGGPQSLQVLLGLAKERVFGTPASLGLSLFQNVVRPVVPGLEGRTRLFVSRSTGLGLTWQQPLTVSNSLGVRFVSERNTTTFPLALQEELPPGLPRGLTVRSSRRTLGLTWSNFRHNGRLLSDASLSGGVLGGEENHVHSSIEYVRLLDDPFSGGRNTWAFRGFLAGAGSFSGKALPVHSRLFAGEELVRGFRAGALAPYAATTSQTADGNLAFQSYPTGANLVVASNTEYRMPLPDWAGGADAAAFFDAGAGWLLPGWLGGDAPELLAGTNGVLRASAGLELRVPLPAVRQNLRLYYAVNPLRLAGTFLLPDGSAFRPGERRSAFGWALGSLF